MISERETVSFQQKRYHIRCPDWEGVDRAIPEIDRGRRDCNPEQGRQLKFSQSQETAPCQSRTVTGVAEATAVKGEGLGP